MFHTIVLETRDKETLLNCKPVSEGFHYKGPKGVI